MGSWENYFGSVGRQNNNNNPHFCTSKNRNIDHRGKEICAHESDNISLLHDSAMSGALNFCFNLLIACNPKENDHIRRKINSKKKNVYM